MALLDTFLNAIGLARPILPKPLGVVGFDDSALTRLSQLPTDWALHIDTEASAGGYLCKFDEGPAQGPPPIGFEQAIVTSDANLERLTGLIIAHDNEGWHLLVQLFFRSKETPNPNGKIYLIDRLLAVGRPLYFSDPAKSPTLAKLLLNIPAVTGVLFREHSVTIEREPQTPWDGIDQAVELAIKAYYLGCGKALTSEEAANFNTPFEQEIMAVLEKTILPAIHQDGGDLSLVGLKDGVLQVSLVGACKTCPASALTLKSGIEKTLKLHFPSTIQSVEAV
jgi:Fe-S cluster biogenesis protein NfuA